MENEQIRVRMAPSPTGPFHIGRVQTALFNWLYARHRGGVFVLRIEDTDVQRSRDEHLQGILDSFRWLGLHWDEGPDMGGPYEPYFQMGRLDTYRHFATQLQDSDHAYPCFCSQEDLAALRKEAEAAHLPFRYPRTCRNLSAEQRAAKEREGRKPALRLAVPDAGNTEWDDLVLGQISVQNKEIGDFVIMRPDGIPTYNFAAVVDDLTMHITDVIRGQDHVPNTPKQIIMYEFLGARTPRFGHVPLVMSSGGGKLSGRYGAEPVTAYGREGYLPDAIVNYLATLGASYAEGKDIYTREELIENFDLQRVSRSGGNFDEAKLDWMNGVYIRSLSRDELLAKALPFLQQAGLVRSIPGEDELDYAKRALCLEQERIRTLAEAPEAVRFFLEQELDYDPALLVVKKSSPTDAARVVDASLDEVTSLEHFDHDSLEPAFRALAERVELKTGVVFGTIRVAITGRTAAPPLFATMEVLGRARVVERLEKARHHLAVWGKAQV